MNTKEIIIVIAAILFLFIAVYTIRKIRKLDISKSHKIGLYYITVVIPILGLALYLHAKNKMKSSV